MSRHGLLVGIDVGTTRVKAIAMNTDGVVRAESEQPMPWRHDGNRAEIDPATIARLATVVAADAAGRANAEAGSPVLGVGVASIGETGVLVDGADRPLAPAVVWHDPRGDVETVRREIGRERFQSTTGMVLGPVASFVKLLWMRRELPDTARATRYYSVAEWVVRSLGGESIAELSLAGRTGMLEIESARPWDEAFELLGTPPLLPQPVVAGSPAGRVGPDGPAILRGAVLTVAGHDHVSAAYGADATADGAVFDSLGSAEALVRTVRAPLDRGRILRLTDGGISVGWSVVEGHLCILSGLATGLTLERVAMMLGATTRAERSSLGEAAAALPARIPGLRLRDPAYEGFAIDGVTDDVSPAGLWRAAVEDMIELADRQLALVELEVGPRTEVVAGGGWLKNAAVRVAKLRQFPGLRITDLTEPGAFGAARLAGRAAGVPLGERRRHDIMEGSATR
jgi:sugar (pentulose or hexulose) kinase